MYSSNAWSQQFNKPQLKLNYREIEWTSLMKECLMETEIGRGNENEAFLDPKLVMDERHKMVKETPKIIGLSQGESHTEGLKLVRMNNRKRMLKEKEDRMIEKEIAKLKQAFENDRIQEQKIFEENTKTRTKTPTVPNFVRCYTKMWKRLEFHNGAFEIDTWLSQSVQMSMETKMNQQGIPLDVKVSVKRQKKAEETVKPVSARNTKEVESVKQFLESKKERKHFEDNNKTEKTTAIEEIKNRTNQKLLKQVWESWKDHSRQQKTRKKERKTYKVKVEEFLKKLQEKDQKNEEKDKHIKKLMKEAKTSQAEACQKLQEIAKVHLRNDEQSKFVKRMEERREERLKRWQEIKERKLKQQEEKKQAEKQIEDEKKQKEEENKRQKLEEWKEKRRLEKEKRKEKERERERIRKSTNLADDHYRKFLLSSFGLRPLQKLIRIRDSQQEKASEFFERRLTEKTFCCWRTNILQEINRKVERSLKFHDRMLKKNAWVVWLEFLQEKLKQSQVAADWNDFRITDRAFKRWKQFVQDRQSELLNKEDIAAGIYERKLKMKYLKKLKDYPELKKLEVAQENRKRKWRQRVKEILPDYQPIDISKDFYSLCV